MRGIRTALIFSVLVGTFIGMASPEAIAAKKKSNQEALYEEVELLAEAITIIQTEYVEVVEPKKLIHGALRGLVESLDRHSQFLSPDAYTEMQVETRGEFGGVGLEITISRDGILTVVAPMDDTPAAGAGLEPNDKIVKIGGESTRGITLHESVKKLRGRPGTQVKITILREDESRLFDVELTRAIIKIQSVKGAEMVADRIGYIRISEFQDNTPRDLDKALNQLTRKELDGLILDLRNNPGGLLDVAVAVTEAFIPESLVVVSTQGRHEEQNQEFVSSKEDPYLDFPIVVLVNGGSASASEIVAGALRDHGRGILMGRKTFGKGSVQTVVPLRDGSAVRLTTSKYYTPSGQSIHGKGLEPDVVVEKTEVPKPRPRGPEALPEDFKQDKIADPYILRAIDLLKGLKVYQETLS